MDDLELIFAFGALLLVIKIAVLCYAQSISADRDDRRGCPSDENGTSRPPSCRP
jgi:hypothetical protein